ncbi:MAG: hypothetical protein Q8Q06_02750, partial [bacterium]|nr:hypothetical protein [bacterium]
MESQEQQKNNLHPNNSTDNAGIGFIIRNGKAFVPALLIAIEFGYATDHITRLARQGKIEALYENKRWYASKESFNAYKLVAESNRRNGGLKSVGKLPDIKAVEKPSTVLSVSEQPSEGAVANIVLSDVQLHEQADTNLVLSDIVSDKASLSDDKVTEVFSTPVLSTKPVSEKIIANFVVEEKPEESITPAEHKQPDYSKYLSGYKQTANRAIIALAVLSFFMLGSVFATLNIFGINGPNDSSFGNIVSAVPQKLFSVLAQITASKSDADFPLAQEYDEAIEQLQEKLELEKDKLAELLAKYRGVAITPAGPGRDIIIREFVSAPFSDGEIDLLKELADKFSRGDLLLAQITPGDSLEIQGSLTSLINLVNQLETKLSQLPPPLVVTGGGSITQILNPEEINTSLLTVDNIKINGNGITTLSGDISITSDSGLVNIGVGGQASTSALFGAGLSDCDAASDKLLWDGSTGTFSCGTESGGGGGGSALEIKEGLTTVLNPVATISFASNSFNVLASGSSEVIVSLDWTNGPASRTADQTITGFWAFSNSASISGNLEVEGTASVSGQFTFGSNASISGNLEIGSDGFVVRSTGVSSSLAFETTSYASASALYGSGLQTCNATTGKLTWSSGIFSCGTDFNTGSPSKGTSVREGTSDAFTHIGSLSFAASSFNVANNASESVIYIDYDNGPASRSIAQTISGLWTFTGGVTVSSPFEVSNTASISQLTLGNV